MVLLLNGNVENSCQGNLLALLVAAQFCNLLVKGACLVICLVIVVYLCCDNHGFLAVLVVGELKNLLKVLDSLILRSLVVAYQTFVVVAVQAERTGGVVLQVVLECSLCLVKLSAAVGLLGSDVCQCVYLAAFHRLHACCA